MLNVTVGAYTENAEKHLICDIDYKLIVLVSSIILLTTVLITQNKMKHNKQ